MEAADTDRDTARRQEIIDAARACFLQFGYAKTSLDDIARRAGISRPLIYRKFKNKLEVFGAVYDATFDAQYPLADEVLAGRGSRKEKLGRIYELVVVDTWAVVAGPMAGEFFAACEQLVPEQLARHERRLLDYTKELLGSRDVAEVFLLAVDGLMSDLPSVAVLRKRVHTLVDQFAR